MRGGLANVLACHESDSRPNLGGHKRVLLIDLQFMGIQTLEVKLIHRLTTPIFSQFGIGSSTHTHNC